MTMLNCYAHLVQVHLTSLNAHPKSFLYFCGLNGINEQEYEVPFLGFILSDYLHFQEDNKIHRAPLNLHL